jgi:hypothetical protein
VRFTYYERLSRSEQATYRKSDAIVAVELEDVAALRALIPAIERGLSADDRSATHKASAALVHALCDMLAIPRCVVKVLARRPAKATYELHGLYERDDETPAILRVWMRTAANEKVVSFRTFVRTLLHEACHHLDFELYDLRDTFHTEGFFKRESSLVRQLLPKAERKPKAVRKAAPARKPDPAAPAERTRPRKRPDDQLALPGMGGE